MELTILSDSPLSLLAPVVAIILAVTTRKVLLSLGAGIVIGALLLADLNPLNGLRAVYEGFLSVFWREVPNMSNIYILLFLLMLGMISSLISVSGGGRAFGEWARQRVRTRSGAQLITVVLGITIFIDDYFNSLTVGSISKPLTDRYRISRAKLAYLIDSTAAPVCVLMPISSWGAYIIAIIGTILLSQGYQHDSPVLLFLSMIPMNLYAVFALGLVFCTAIMDLNVGPMAAQENAAMGGTLYDVRKGTPPGALRLEEDKNGRVSDLVLPIVILIMVTLIVMIWTGGSDMLDQRLPFSLIGAFEHTDVTLSLFAGGLVSLLFAGTRLLFGGISGDLWQSAVFEGGKSMLPAIFILIFTWVLTSIIGDLGTGKYLASLISGNMSPSYLPMILFVVSGAMAFATGTSWGTFSIMLPIAGDMGMAADTAMMLPMMAAVLAGAVFGDHCSPISDTTILSSTGASCHHIDHINSQFPYAASIAVVAALGYLVMGVTRSISAGFVSSLVAFLILIIAMWVLSGKSRRQGVAG